MILGKKRETPREWEAVSVGETDEFLRRVEDRDVLLYLGVTEDTNPLFLQSVYAEQTPYGHVVVPPGLLLGWVTGRVSKRLPGPGSRVVGQRITFPEAARHSSAIRLRLKVIGKDDGRHQLTLEVIGEDEDGRRVIDGELDVLGPPPTNRLFRDAYENF
ncbi:MaoC/PaaZ C-terminal domain-containing protein [Desmospora profundinema]|uniref:Acyl dehydratase n=1 Tax=Desmospora profundinema TaxID=1571184 RepID=A0ABU1IS80_9BACL|nr:MaoC/PaaZ C-terminal domain-containing protein [Desmospora profundinema]MDR6226615.1 acyl dehydratase [Desmospora profundinema]